MTNLNISRALPNLRDVGGLAVSRSAPASGSTSPSPTTATIRRGILYRSAAPSSNIEDKASIAAALTQHRITHTYDLRSVAEIIRYDKSSENAAAILPPGVQRMSTPVFRNEDYSPEANAARFEGYLHQDPAIGFTIAYRHILAAGPSGFTPILKHLAADPADGLPSPILVHCTAGKDRTGVLCALVLSLCGVSDQDIAAEYALSEPGLAEWRKTVIARALGHPGMSEMTAQMSADSAGLTRMLSSKPEAMLAVLKMLREEYGSAEAYVMEKCGLSKEEVARIRHNLIVTNPSL